MRNMVRETAGFTLIEFMMTAAIIVIGGAAIFGFFTATSNAFVTMTAIGTLQTQFTQATNVLTQDTRLSFQTPASCCGGAYTQDLDSQDNQRSQLILGLPSVDADGVPLITGQLDYIVYDFNAATGALRRIVSVDAASSRRNGTSTVARQLTRVRYNVAVPREVTVTLDGRATERGRSFQSTLTSRIAFRN